MLFLLQIWGWHVVQPGREAQVLTPKRRVVSSQTVLPTANCPCPLPSPPGKVLECVGPCVRERAVLSPQQGPIHQDCAVFCSSADFLWVRTPAADGQQMSLGEAGN